jgi:LacI family transcriptional regulator
MREVAALAGVSLKTVSRVVNREAGVSDPLAERVLLACAQLDYRHDLGASSLRRADRKTATLGLLLNNVANPYSAAVHRSIEDVAGPRGLAVLTASVDEDPVRERALAEAFLARRVDGLVVMPASGDQSYLQREREAGLPVVFVDRPPSLLDADAVLIDNAGAARRATEHLLSYGHRRIAVVTDLHSIPTAGARRAGALAALRAAGVDPDLALVRVDQHTSDEAERTVAELLARSDAPTAVLACQNLVTVGALRALRRQGRQHQVALVGIDDFPLADLLEPAVTVVAQDPQAIGRRVAEVLFRRLDGDTSATRQHVVPTRLVARGSGEIPPA